MDALAWRRFARPSLPGDGGRAPRSPWYRSIPLLLTVAVLSYSAISLLLAPTYSYGTEVWSAIPCALMVVGIAWKLGLRAGVLMGLLAMPLNTLLANIQAALWEPLSTWPAMFGWEAPGPREGLPTGGWTGWDVLLQLDLLAESITLVLIAAVVGRLHDVTRELARGREALQASEEGYRRLVETSPDAIVVTDLETTIVLCNQRGVELYGCERVEELLGRSGFEFIVPEDHERVHENMARTLEQGSTRNLEYTLLRQDGSRYPAEISASVITDTAGQPVGFLAVVQDITARKEAEQTLVLARDTAERANRIKSEFLSTVSHELRTPLSSLLGFSELITHRQLKADRIQQYASIMYLEAQRLRDLIDNLLDLQRLEARRETFAFAPVDLPAVVDSTLRVYQGESQKHTLVTELPEGLPPVQADAAKLQQVLANLVSNAIKYSPAGGEIRLAAQLEADQVHLTVADQGYGIPPTAQDRLFTRFYRIPGQERMGIRGTGLGLALVKELVEAHRGKVWAESAGPDQGSTFHVTLPLAPRTSQHQPRGALPTNRVGEQAVTPKAGTLPAAG